MISIRERNQRILKLRQEGMSQSEVARKFKLSPTRVYLIEKHDGESRSTQERRAGLQKQIQEADDIEKIWPVEDLLDALGLIVVTKKRLIDHFLENGQSQISLREFMDMCLDAPVEGLNFMMSPLLRVYGVGKIGFWNVVNSLTKLDMGNGCNQEWQGRLLKVKQKWKITGATPYSRPAV